MKEMSVADKVALANGILSKIPDGWEFVGYRKAKEGEWIMGCGHPELCRGTETVCDQVVVRKCVKILNGVGLSLKTGWLVYCGGDYWWLSTEPILKKQSWVVENYFWSDVSVKLDQRSFSLHMLPTVSIKTEENKWRIK